MLLVKDHHEFLINRGWTLIRRGKHPIYKFTNGYQTCITTTGKDKGRRWLNFQAHVKRLEAKPPLGQEGCLDPTPIPPLVMKACPDKRPYIPTPHNTDTQENLRTPDLTPPLLVTLSTPSPNILTKEEPMASKVNPENMTWFDWLRAVRLEANMTPKSLADLFSDIPLSSGLLLCTERGSRKFSAKEYARWKEVFDITPATEFKNFPLASAETLAHREAWHAAHPASVASNVTAPKTSRGEKPTLTFSQWVRSFREATKLSATMFVAEKGLNMRPEHLSKVERDERQFTEQEFAAWHLAVGSPVMPQHLQGTYTLRKTSSPQTASVSNVRVVTCPQGLSRNTLIMSATKLLSSKRLTDDEVKSLVDALEKSTLDLLLN